MNRKTWNSTKAAAMDLDALDKSKKKGKEKGKWNQPGVGNGPGKGPDGVGKDTKKGAAAKKKGKEKDKEKKTESRECYGCGEKGHLKQNCPNKDKWKVQPTTGTGGADGGTGAKPKDHAALLPAESPVGDPSKPWIFALLRNLDSSSSSSGRPRSMTKKEKDQAGLTKQGGPGKEAGGRDTANLPVHRHNQTRRPRVGCWAGAALLLATFLPCGVAEKKTELDENLLRFERPEGLPSGELRHVPGARLERP